MIQQSDKTWRQGQAAATLLVAYMFVLQGLVLGLTMGGALARLPGEAVCLTSRAAPASGNPAGPGRNSRGEDACCVQHCSGSLDEGVVASFVELSPPGAAVAAVLTPPSVSGVGPERGALPLGARAPPLFAA